MATVVAFVEDLMFLSRIREAARGSGVEVQAVRRVPDLLAACRAGARLALLDLDSARLPALEALAALRAEPALQGTAAVGFLGHEATDRAREAREAGCDQVLPRGVFVQSLPSLLQRAAQTVSAKPGPDPSRNTSS
jgi:CheY-like chemotaxis protein